MVEQLKQFAGEVESLLRSGASLAEVAKWSYVRRQVDANSVYLGVLNSSEAGTIELEARPTKVQKQLSVFFAEKAPGSVLSRYTFRVTLQGVEFLERLGQGAGNVRRL
jgi:hypothetical protein